MPTSVTKPTTLSASTAPRLKVKVVGEGGNLGLTQLGRIEAAVHGVKLNTDAIDNSAGVDTSDHEVNIKIALDRGHGEDTLTCAQARGTTAGDDRSRSPPRCCRTTTDQNVVLGNARRGATALVTVHQRMIRQLEHENLLNRALEYLPDDEEFATRRAAGEPSPRRNSPCCSRTPRSRCWLS